ncbi:hypothetical protein N7540_004278 [Penicillium herquei]|nr:hypothetical protein N7540_004278 [Penicillium herquei]
MAMSFAETSHLVQTVRTKLRREGSRANNELRVVVGHANLLHTLIAKISELEIEEECWMNTVDYIAKSD